jgi:hypothetical protein
MGDWRLDQNERWVYHEGDPASDPTATSLMPAVVDNTVDVPPRVDDWCEDRPPGELTDSDERE